MKKINGIVLSKLFCPELRTSLVFFSGFIVSKEKKLNLLNVECVYVRKDFVPIGRKIMPIFHFSGSSVHRFSPEIDGITLITIVENKCIGNSRGELVTFFEVHVVMIGCSNSIFFKLYQSTKF